MKTFLLINIIVVSALALPQPKSAESQKVFGGEPAKDGEFPYMVSLRNNGYLACDGSIISRRTILTAAHCVDDVEDIRNLTVTTGTNSLSTGGKTYKVAKLLPHPEFNRSAIGYPNDIGLLYTVEEIQLGNLVSLTTLPTATNWSDPEVGDTVIAMGWGLIDMIHDTDILMTNNLTVYSNKECSKLLDKPIADSQICAGGSQGNGVCSGDSGSPSLVTLHSTEIGIVSWGRICATGVPDLFTRVSAFIDWIQENLKE